MSNSLAAETPADDDVLKAVRMAIAATDKKDYNTALKLFNQVYGNPSLEAPVDGLSHFGLCVAIAEKQTKKGIDLCRQAMSAQFYESAHHANLIRLHLAKGNRKTAIRVLEESSRKLPNDKRLVRLRQEMGDRRRNPIPFLPRSSALNKMIGMRMRGRGSRATVVSRGGGTRSMSLQNLEPVQLLLFGFLGFASVFSVTFYILYQNAYK